MRKALVVAAIGGLAIVTLMAQTSSSSLAPTGTLRAAFLRTNPVHGRIDPATGEATGPVPDLARELARRLGVPARIIASENAAAVIAALNTGQADIGVLAYDETRAREVEFGAPVMTMLNSYLVKVASPVQKSADVDKNGVTVAAVKGQTQELFVSRTLKQARIRLFDVMPGDVEVQRLLGSGEVDAFAINRQRALEAQAASASALRALSDSFLDVDQCIVVAKGARGKLDELARAIDELRQSGFIRAAIERARLTGVEVPSSRQPR